MRNKRSAGDGPDVKGIFSSWISAYDDGDVKQVLSLFDPGIIYSEPCVPDQTYTALAKWYEFDFSRSGPRPHWTFEVESVEVGGDLAVVISHWKGFTDFGTRLQAEVRSFRSVDILRNGTNGWKIIRTLNDPSACCPDPKKTRKRKKK